MARNGENGAATAIVWQTGTRRADFEIYGFALHVDFMKHKMNSFEWPYISNVAVDGNGSPRCTVEGIACVERNEAHIIAAKAMLEMALGRSCDDVFVVFADGILCSDILVDDGIGLSSSRFFWEHDIWPKQFGGAWSIELSYGVYELLHAENKEQFNYAFDELMNIF